MTIDSVPLDTLTAAPGVTGPSTDAATEFMVLDEIIAAARHRLQPPVRDFLDGGSGDESHLRANREAFARWAFRQRVMSGLGAPDLATRFLGVDLALPILSAPFGADTLFHPEGQRAVARANASMGTVSIAPEAGSFAIEEIAATAPRAARFAQLHPLGSRENFVAMLHRIVAAGYDGVCVTLDCPTAGWRERNYRNRFDFDHTAIAGNYPLGSAAHHAVFGQLFEMDQTVWTWDALADAMSEVTLPWIAKGILTVEDACAAVDAGASAVLVSNHGGRQLHHTPPPIVALPDIAAAVGDRAQIALDSGVRSGADIVKAIALGADVVVLGRMVAYGLAAAGESGVRRVLELLRDEMTTVLTLLGRGGIADLDAAAVQEVTW